MRLSIGEALRTVLDTQPNTELSRCILSYLHEGHTVPDELAVHALEIALMDMKCKTRGYASADRGDISPLLFEVEGTPCVLPSPAFSGVDIFDTVFIG